MSEYKKVIIVISVCLLALPAVLAAKDQPAVQPAPQAPAKPAIEAEYDEFWDEEPAGPEQPRFSEERIGQILEQIRKTDPGRADELMRLKEQNPERFNDELRTEMLRHFRESRQRWGRGDEPAGPERLGPARQGQTEMRPLPGPEPVSPAVPMSGQDGPRAGHWKERLEKMHNEFIAWLEKNYPDKAKELKELRERDPDGYVVKIGEAMRRYEPIMRAQKTDPKLAEIMTEDLELQTQRDKILQELRFAKDPQRKGLIKELKEVLNRRFDVIMAQKQIQYDQLLARLEKLKAEVGKRENELGKLKVNKDKAVEEHLQELINQTEKIKWD